MGVRTVSPVGSNGDLPRHARSDRICAQRPSSLRTRRCSRYSDRPAPLRERLYCSTSDRPAARAHLAPPTIQSPAAPPHRHRARCHRPRHLNSNRSLFDLKKGVGSGIDNARPFEDLQKLFDYLLVGTQLGGVLRGLGLFPFFANTDPASLLTGPDRPEPLLATWGFLASLALLTYSLWKRPRGEAFRIWSLGQLIIITSMLLPAFGRWQYGMEQSLSLRYHYATIVGLAILLFPLLAGSALSTNIQKRRAAPTLGAALLILYFAVQLKAGNNYLVTPFGPTHRAYAAQLRDWNINLRALGAVTSYEAAGTALEGQHPLHPHSFTSQRHPDEVYRALNWLDPERYPWVDKNRYPVRTDL